MDITSIGNLSKLNGVDTYGKSSLSSTKSSNAAAFDNILQSAMDMLQETNQSVHEAEDLSLDFAMGNSENTHDLAIAQQKALTAIQYTVAVRDAVVDAYKEIMQLQF